MIAVNIEKKLKTYGGQQVLKIAGEFAVGSITKIHGPSGAGKTTFLKIIAGLISTEKGLIKFDAETWLDTDKSIDLSPQQRQTGFVFQDYALFPNMTVLGHLQYATYDTAWIARLLALGKLEAFADHKPIHLSGGQQQRLAILRALANKPRLLLMDEPFSALDKQTKASFIAGLKEIFGQLGTTVLIVSHNLQELEALDGVEMYIWG
ncbi:MAG: ATP-binding cassette domain-containing protein [Sphingobacteriaceae bacterium]|nr:MAG: ATP-binding cassette domain-containing protein [Sphingobacteriaceae bacterium]